MSSFPVGTPAINLVSQVADPTNVKTPDGNIQTLTSDQQGGLLVRELGGRCLAAAQRGNVFLASTLIAGVSIPAFGNTLASTAGIVNPTGSGKNVELIALGLSSVTIEVALKQFGIGFQVAYSQNGGPPTSVTKLTAVGSPISAATKSPVAYAYTAATLTNAGALGPLLWPFGNYETAVGFNPSWFYFNGEVLMGPDTAMAIANTTTALAAVNVTYMWSEWPA